MHQGIRCAGCSMDPLRGDRFKCSVCKDYDLCEWCYDEKATVHPNHRFHVQKAVRPAPKPAPHVPSVVVRPVPAAGPVAVPAVTAFPDVEAMDANARVQWQMAQLMATMGTVETRANDATNDTDAVSTANTVTPVAEITGVAWLRAPTPCSLCLAVGKSEERQGVICFRRRKHGHSGCGKGVCWSCMATGSREALGMVRTTKDEFESLEDGAWWLHEACMVGSDLRDYFGGEKELASARAAADAMHAVLEAAPAKATTDSDPLESMREKLRSSSVKELKSFIARHNASHSGCVEKSELLSKAIEVAEAHPCGPGVSGPAWMPAGMACRLCTKVPTCGGVICRRRRPDGSVGGCGEGVCWRCMKRAPREKFGKVRTTKEEFESLKEDAWWMHEACFEGNDYQDYFNESESEADKVRRKTLRKRRLGRHSSSE